MSDFQSAAFGAGHDQIYLCPLYTSDAADEEDSVVLGGRRSMKKKKTGYCTEVQTLQPDIK